MTTPLGLSTYRWNNNIKSVLLLAVFPFLLLGVVMLYLYGMAHFHSGGTNLITGTYASTFGMVTAADTLLIRDFVKERTLAFLPVVFSIATAWILIGSFFNELLISLSTRAKRLARAEAPNLYNTLETLCISRGLRMPKLYMIDTSATNAYASGLSENSYAITVTRGLVEKLQNDELEAVLAHELSHIISNDARLLVITALFANLLLFLPQAIIGLVKTACNFADEGDSPIILIPMFIFLRLPVAICVLSSGYAISTLFRLALSRRREFQADAGAVELTKRPESLIRALEKIEADADLPYLPSGVQAMLIQNPPGWISLFDSHPPLAERLTVLRRMAGLAPEIEPPPFSAAGA